MAFKDEIGLPEAEFHYIITERGSYVKLVVRVQTAVVFLPLCLDLNTGLFDQGKPPIGEQKQCSDAHCLEAWLLSDVEGMFGKICPECRKYFRTSHTKEICHCAYCMASYSNVSFMTPNQIAFLNAYYSEAVDAHNSKTPRIIKPHDLISNLTGNASKFYYVEEEQQSMNTCPNPGCNGTRFEILGDYGRCPSCGYWNASRVFNDKLTRLQQQLVKSKVKLADEQQEQLESILAKSVGVIDSFGSHIANLYKAVWLHPDRRKTLSNLNFQKIELADQILSEVFGFGLLEKFTEVERLLLRKLFQQRHLVVHRGGIVDAEYLDKSGDQAQRLGQKIQLEAPEIEALISMLRRIGQRLMGETEKIKPEKC